MPPIRPFLAALALPLSLALAACGSESEGEAPVTSEPIAPITAPQGQTWTEVAAETPEGGFRIGNPGAPLKLVEFASHTCSHCALFSNEAAADLDQYVESGVLSYEIRNQIHDGLDLTIALLARCGEPAAFHPLAKQAWSEFEQIIGNAQANPQAMQAAMETQDDTRFQKIGQASGLIDFFAARGISRDQAMQCLADSGKAEQLAQKAQAESDKLEVQGTPTFFLNGRRVEGTTWQQLEPALQQAGAR